MVTMPPEAASDPVFARTLLARGVESVRINCAHDTPAAWEAMLTHLRAAEQSAGDGRRVRVLMDLGGPKVRTALAGDPRDQPRVRAGDRILLTRGPAVPSATLPQIGCAQPGVVEQVPLGAAVWIDDGKIGARVAAVTDDGALLDVIRAPLRGKRLRPDKGLNFPGTTLHVTPLTAKDRQDLDFVARHTDLIGYSFVQTPGDVALLLDALSSGDTPPRRDLGLVLKIETALAVRQLPELIVAAAGRLPTAVMIARGDLAVEVGFERLAEIPEELLWLCEAAHVPVIWATQVLEQLAQEGLPARGEVTDAAMGARAECVMLNKGPFILDAVDLLDGVLRRMPGHQSKKTPQLRALRSWEDLFAAESPVAPSETARPTAMVGATDS
jgi:pyruvate kinase